MENLGVRLKTTQKVIPPRVAVVGAGWAGCAAAVQLAEAGAQVLLLEAARQLGGRARRVEEAAGVLDNGQHILLGAYAATLKLMRKVGVREEDALLRLPLQIVYAPHPAAMHFVAPRLPAPWHVLGALLGARGLSREDKLALARFSSSARWMDWMLYQDCSVAELLERHEQTPQLNRLLWRPLCIAALNTPPERASAQVFLNVLKDSLGARRAASDMLLPRTDLSTLFPDAAAAFVRQHGGQVRLGARVLALTRVTSQEGWRVELAEGFEDVDAVVMAVPAAQARAMTQALKPDLVPAFEWEPITTCYLQYAPDLRLPRPLLALLDDAHAPGQFVFDRGQLDTRAAGSMAVVISAATSTTELPQAELAMRLAAQLAQAFDDPRLATPLQHRIITEKRATWSCTPGLVRPACDSGIPGLWLAGDYTAGPYPATLEAAVRSGIEAAQGVLAQSSSRTRSNA